MRRLLCFVELRRKRQTDEGNVEGDWCGKGGQAWPGFENREVKATERDEERNGEAWCSAENELRREKQTRRVP